MCATHLHGLDCRCVDRRCNRIGCLLCDICVSVVFFALLGPTVVVLLCSGVYEEQAPLGGGAAIELFKNSFLLLVAMPLLLVASSPDVGALREAQWPAVQTSVQTLRVWPFSAEAVGRRRCRPMGFSSTVRRVKAIFQEFLPCTYMKTVDLNICRTYAVQVHLQCHGSVRRRRIGGISGAGAGGAGPQRAAVA